MYDSPAAKAIVHKKKLAPGAPTRRDRAMYAADNVKRSACKQKVLGSYAGRLGRKHLRKSRRLRHFSFAPEMDCPETAQAENRLPRSCFMEDVL
jgi:hypothetical protein